MNVYRRNVLVGAVVLAAASVFIWMILEFSSRTAEVFAPPQMKMYFLSDRADGLSDGSGVYFLGVPAGRVLSLQRSEDGTKVMIAAMVDRKPPLPANVAAVISQTNPIGGGTTLNFQLTGETPQGELAPNTLQTPIATKYVGLQFNVLPASFTETAGDIGAMAKEAHKTLADLNQSGVVADLDNTIKQVGVQLSKAGDTLNSVNTLVNDPKMQQNILDSVDKIHTATEKLNTLIDNLQNNSKQVGTAVVDAQQHFDDLSKQLGDRLTQISDVLASVQSITDKMDKGKGTAGALVNDPKLYESLVESAKELDATATDLHRLIDQWEQEGVTLKLK